VVPDDGSRSGIIRDLWKLRITVRVCVCVCVCAVLGCAVLVLGWCCVGRVMLGCAVILSVHTRVWDLQHINRRGIIERRERRERKKNDAAPATST
jgi:heme O synthase-like polyprenyltransferase